MINSKSNQNSAPAFPPLASNEPGSPNEPLTVWATRMIEARLLAGLDVDAAFIVLDEFEPQLDLMSAKELRRLAMILSDIAWDLADGWACDRGSAHLALQNIREGHARGWV